MGERVWKVEVWVMFWKSVSYFDKRRGVCKWLIFRWLQNEENFVFLAFVNCWILAGYKSC